MSVEFQVAPQAESQAPQAEPQAEPQTASRVAPHAGFQVEPGQLKSQPHEEAGEPRKWAIIAAQVANEKKASDIVVQDVGALIGVTEYFVIVTAANNRQVNAIVDAIKEALRDQAGIRPFHQEDTHDASWELLDYGSVVVHVFQPETREYYQLESLWNDAPLMDLVAEAGITDALYSERIAQLFEKADNKRTNEKRTN